jgi:hypothetical protein
MVVVLGEARRFRRIMVVMVVDREEGADRSRHRDGWARGVEVLA